MTSNRHTDLDYSFAIDNMAKYWKEWFRHSASVNLQWFLVPQEHDGIECQLLATQQITEMTLTINSN